MFFISNLVLILFLNDFDFCLLTILSSNFIDESASFAYVAVVQSSYSGKIIIFEWHKNKWLVVKFDITRIKWEGFVLATPWWKEDSGCRNWWWKKKCWSLDKEGLEHEHRVKYEKINMHLSKELTQMTHLIPSFNLNTQPDILISAPQLKFMTTIYFFHSHFISNREKSNYTELTLHKC